MESEQSDEDEVVGRNMLIGDGDEEGVLLRNMNNY